MRRGTIPQMTNQRNALPLDGAFRLRFMDLTGIITIIPCILDPRGRCPPMKKKWTFALLPVCLCILALATGCQKVPTSSNTEPEDTAARDAALVEHYIQTYENFVLADAPELGSDWSDQYLAIDFAFGVLFPEREQYLDPKGPNTIVIPAERLTETAKLFFDFPIDGGDLGDTLYYSADYQPSGVTAVLRNSETDENGDIRLTVERTRDGRGLFPAVYTFRKAPDGDKLPEHLARFEIDGVWYRFVSVRRLTGGEAGMPAENGVILIRTPEELLAFAEDVNSGSWHTRFCTYLLEEDLDLAGLHFPPIGSSRAAPLLGDPTPDGFCGVFDGQGHTISNLTISGEGELGFFSQIGEGGAVRNLTLENVSIDGSLNPDGTGTLSGGLAARVVGGTVENCRVTGLVTGYHAGGIAGEAFENSSFTGCTAETTVTGVNAAGGFCGTSSMSAFAGCRASGTVQAIRGGDPDEMPNEIGGLVGSSNSSSYTECIADAVLETHVVSSGMVGLFAGYHSNGSLTGCLYNRDKAGAWKPVGTLNGIEGYEISLEGRSAEEIAILGRNEPPKIVEPK